MEKPRHPMGSISLGTSNVQSPSVSRTHSENTEVRFLPDYSYIFHANMDA